MNVTRFTFLSRLLEVVDLAVARPCDVGDGPALIALDYVSYSNPDVEQIQRKFQVRGSTSEDSPRIRAGVEKKEQQAELKTTKARSR